MTGSHLRALFMSAAMLPYSSDVTGNHTTWECVYRQGMLKSCEDSCLCSCHGFSPSDNLYRFMGLHVHNWTGKVYHLEGAPDNMSIWCTSCRMNVPRGSRPGIVLA